MRDCIRVMLIEDHPEYREAIGLALEKAPDMELVGKVGSSERAMVLLQDLEPTKLPALILLDLNLPGKSGLELLPNIRESFPQTEVIVLTQSDVESDVLIAIKHGAVGYLLKSSTAKDVIQAIRLVADGEAIIDTKVVRYLIQKVNRGGTGEGAQQLLSPREMEILELLGQGLAKKEVAKQLSISFSSVATYVSRVYEKLDVQNAPAAVAKAFRIGIFPPEN